MVKTSPVAKVGLFHFLRDVFVASINKGQFPLAILGLILGIYCFRVSPDVLAEHGREFFKGLRDGYILGYFLFLTTLGGFYVYAKRLRKKHHDELTRIANEKTELQKKLLSSKVQSSKKR